MIAIASTSGINGAPTVSAYSAAKHGVLGLVRSLALEVARDGITCNAICPGFVDTDMAQSAIENLMERQSINRDLALSKITSGNPMRRLIDPKEVAETAFFLASSSASSINGHALSVSGGAP